MMEIVAFFWPWFFPLSFPKYQAINFIWLSWSISDKCWWMIQYCWGKECYLACLKCHVKNCGFKTVMLPWGNLTGLELFSLLLVSGRQMQPRWISQRFPRLLTMRSTWKTVKKRQVSRYSTTTGAECLEQRPRNMHRSNCFKLILMITSFGSSYGIALEVA